jgi:hypothetical protein
LAGHKFTKVFWGTLHSTVEEFDFFLQKMMGVVHPTTSKYKQFLSNPERENYGNFKKKYC